jgi:hypothetical protein
VYGALAEIRIEPVSEPSQGRSPNAPGAVDVEDVVTGRGPIKTWRGVERHRREGRRLRWFGHRKLAWTWAEVVIHVVARRVPKSMDIPEATKKVVFGATFRFLVAL